MVKELLNNRSYIFMIRALWLMLKPVFTFMQPGDQGILIYTGQTRNYDTNVDLMNYQYFLQEVSF